MPRAKTGCFIVLYSTITKEGSDALEKMVKRLPDGISRPLLIDAILKRAAKQPLPKIAVPKYTPHKRVVRKTMAAA
jgi:hypothetical protein